MNTRSEHALIAAGLLLVLTFAAYSNTFHSDFHFDDSHHIVKNQHIRDMGNIPRFFTDTSMATYYTDQKSGYRPMTYVTFAVDYALSGYETWSYHLTNMLLHLISAFMVYLIAGAVLRVSGRDDPLPLALTAAMLFALHPIETSAVTYISGRAVLLAGMSYLAAFYFFVRSRTGRGGAGVGPYVWTAISVLFYFAGLLSKEMAVSLPVMCIAYDIIFTARGNGSRSIKTWLCYPLYGGALAAYLLIRRAVAGFVASPEQPISVGDYLMSEAKAALLYLRLLILPINQNADYDLPVTVSPDIIVALSLIFILCVLYVLYRIGRKNPAAAFFGLWFFVTLAPESSFIPISDIAVEYRLYLPSVGFVLFAAITVDGLLIDRKTVRKALVAFLLVMLFILTSSRNTVWATERTLWADVVKKSPYSARAHSNLGAALVNEKRYDEGISELTKTLEIDSFFGQVYAVYNSLGICYLETGRYDMALDEFERAVRIYPGFVEAYANMGMVHFKQGRYEEAVDAFRTAEKLNPGYSRVHLMAGKSYRKLGRLVEAAGEMEVAAQGAPRDFETRYNLALVYSELGQKDNAMEEARVAGEIAVDDTQSKDARALMDSLSKGR